MCGGSRSPRASPETSQGRSGTRRPAGWLVTKPPGGIRQHHPSATTSGTRECANARLRTPLVASFSGLAKVGSEPTNRRSGAPRGGHSRRAGCVSGSARDARRDASRLRAYVTGPRRVPRTHPSACRRSASLFRGGNAGKARGTICLARMTIRAHAISVTLRRERSELRRATARVRWRPVAVVLRGRLRRAPQDDGELG